jgi:hypothetical protein
VKAFPEAEAEAAELRVEAGSVLAAPRRWAAAAAAGDGMAVGRSRSAAVRSCAPAAACRGAPSCVSHVIAVRKAAVCEVCASVGGGDGGPSSLRRISLLREAAVSSGSWLAMDSSVFVAISAPCSTSHAILQTLQRL